MRFEVIFSESMDRRLAAFLSLETFLALMIISANALIMAAMIRYFWNIWKVIRNK